MGELEALRKSMLILREAADLSGDAMMDRVYRHSIVRIEYQLIFADTFARIVKRSPPAKRDQRDTGWMA